MRGDAISKSWRVGACVVAALLACGCQAPGGPQALSSAAPAVAPGTARIWIYRDYEPYVSRNIAPVSLNGSVAGYAPPDGSAFYRDVAPGRYHITAASSGQDVNQDRSVELGPGQQAFVKILTSDTWDSGGLGGSFRRDTYYVSLVPPQVAQGELAARPLRGG